MSINIKFPLAGDNAFCEAKLTNGASFYYLLAQPNQDHSLMQIPVGPQPRDVDANAKIPKAIFNSYLNNEKFPIMCRGLRLVIDDGSFEVYKHEGQDWVQFACAVPLSGQYDGGHCQTKVTQAIKALTDPTRTQIVPLHLTEQRAFRDAEDVRSVSKASNAVQPQKKKSELNLAGRFNTLKQNITYCALDNIGFKENQLSSADEKVKPECDVSVVTNMLATMLPKAMKRGTMLGDISKYPKKGPESVAPEWENESTGPLLRVASEHVDMVLGFHDFVQSSMQQVLHGNHENYGILHKAMRKQTQKPLSERLVFSSRLFIDAKPRVYTLSKELLPLVCYSIFNSAFSYDPCSGKFETDYTLEELKAIWTACGKDVLDIIEARFTTEFETVFNNRWGDFGIDESLWTLCEKKASTTINNKKLWRPYVATTYSEAAAK